MHTSHVDELVEQWLVARDVRQVLADATFEVHVENGAGRLVRRTDTEIGVDRDHAGRQAREYDLEVCALCLDQGLAEAGFATRRRQALGHVVEGIDEKPDLVARRRRQSRIEITGRNRTRAGDQVLDRRDEPARKHQRTVDSRQQ